MFTDGFPSSLNDEYKTVISVISRNTVNDVSIGIAEGYNSENAWYNLADKTTIRFPYRMYFVDEDSAYEGLSTTEKLIYDCIYTRNCDGYVRQTHLLNILNSNFPEWCMPYILRLSSEYVVEILVLIYNSVTDKNEQMIHDFCFNNPRLMKRSYQRMVSYWNEYYKEQSPRFNEYIGKKLYHECFMPNTNFEKLQ